MPRAIHPAGQLHVNPLRYNFIQPESPAVPLQKAQMPATFGRQQSEIGIGLERGMIEDRERNKCVILGLHQQGGNADAIEKAVCGLGFVVSVGGAEAERGRRELIVDRGSLVRAVRNCFSVYRPVAISRFRMRFTKRRS